MTSDMEYAVREMKKTGGVLRIEIVNHSGTISLRDGAKEIVRKEFLVDNDLSNTLLVHIDELLKVQGVDAMSLEDVECRTSDAGYTTERIAQSVVGAYRFALART